MHRDHVGMVEPSQQQGLAFGPAAGGVGQRRPRPEHLHRHLPVEADVAAAIDHAHAAAADRLEVNDARNERQAAGQGG